MGRCRSLGQGSTPPFSHRYPPPKKKTASVTEANCSVMLVSLTHLPSRTGPLFYPHSTENFQELPTGVTCLWPCLPPPQPFSAASLHDGPRLPFSNSWTCPWKDAFWQFQLPVRQWLHCQHCATDASGCQKINGCIRIHKKNYTDFWHHNTMTRQCNHVTLIWHPHPVPLLGQAGYICHCYYHCNSTCALTATAVSLSPLVVFWRPLTFAKPSLLNWLLIIWLWWRLARILV